MAKIIDMQAYKKAKNPPISSIESLIDMMEATLACPQCEVECELVTVNDHGSAIYRCVGNGHRALTWSIDESGALRHGTSGALYR